MINETLEKYVETISTLQKPDSRVHTRNIAQALDIKEASVTEMFKRLEKEGLVDYKPYHGVYLTQKGKTIAGDLSSRHATLAELFKALGIDAETADEDACKIEHVASAVTIDRLKKFVDFIEDTPCLPVGLEHFQHYLETGEYRCFPESSEK